MGSIRNSGRDTEGGEPCSIQNGCVITVNDGGDVHPRGAVRIRDGQIEEVSAESLTVEPGEDVIDASGQIVMPGLVNTHVHLFQALLRGVFEEEDFPKFLSYMYACGTELSPEDSKVAAELGCVESLRAGVTTILDHHFLNRGSELALATAQGMRSAGVRAIVARTVMDTGDIVPLPLREVPAQALQSIDELIAACAPEIETGLLRIWTGPNTPGANASAEAVLAARDYSQDRGIRQSAHVAEYPGVLDAVRERYGVEGVVRWLDGLDALVPNLLAAHAIRVQPDEVAMVAASGVSVSHNPFSNLVAGDRTAPVADYIAAGITRRSRYGRGGEQQLPDGLRCDEGVPAARTTAPDRGPADLRLKCTAHRDHRRRTLVGPGRRVRKHRGWEAR